MESPAGHVPAPASGKQEFRRQAVERISRQDRQRLISVPEAG